jgi:uncharacterized membrane protein
MYTDPTMTNTTSYNFNCNEIIPWSGAAIDDAHQRLILWGGGHSDYAGNEVFVLNLSGTPSWQLFTNPTIPIPFDGDGKNWEGLNPYYARLADGGTYQPGAQPASRHTYNGLQYVPYQNKLYSFGGAVANVGFLSSEVWSLDMTAKTWTMVGPPFSKSPGYPTSAYNPSNGHIVMHDKSWSLFDYDPHTNNWATLTTSYHVEDGTTAAVDPVHNLLVVVGSAGTTDNTSYPALPTSHTVQVFSLTSPYTMQSWSGAGCDLTYRSGGLAWDSALGLMVGYPGGGNQVYFLNTSSTTVNTPYGSVLSHQCLDVPISQNPSPVKGVDYPQDPEGVWNGSNYGIYGRFEYLPSLDVFVMVNDHTQNAWIMRLTGGTSAPSYTLISSTNSLSIPQGSYGTATVTTRVAGGFNNSVVLSSAGAPAGVSVSFSPTSIAAPGAGASTVTVSVAANAAAGTYPIVVSGLGGGDTDTAVINVTVTGSGQPGLSVSASPSTLSAAQGNQCSSTITTTITDGFNSPVALSASGAPGGTTVSFSPSTIGAPGSGTSTMTIVVGANTPIGTYPITVNATGGGLAPTTAVNLTVTASQQPNLTVSASPSSLSIVQGTQGTSSITTSIGGGFNSSVTLSASGLPAATTATFNPSTIASPGSGNSTMTFTVGASTPPGTYPIAVTAAGGGLAPTTTITLTVTTQSSGWQQGFNFRATPGYVNDPPNTTHVMATTSYPTTVNGATFGWMNTALVLARDRSRSVDARLAGINAVANGSPATFTVNLPAPGSYNVSLAMGDAGYGQCWVMCQVQFRDGSTVLGTVTGNPNMGYFYDPGDHDWSATAWPTNNLTLPLTLTGNRLTVVVGTNNSSGDVTPIAFLGVSQSSGGGSPNFTVSASPSSLSVAQGSQATSTITTALSSGFNNSIALSASGAPTGTTVSFNPSAIPAPGSGSSTMTFVVGSSTPTGIYPVTVTASGGGIRQTATVTLTVTAGQHPTLTVGASPSSLSVTPGTQGTSTISTTAAGGFNSSVALSSTGAPSGTTISFNPGSIPAPGGGTSAMTITVGASTPAGTYPITVIATGGGLAPTTTVTLTVTSASGWQQGFNFRATASYVNDPAQTTHVLANTSYPTTVGGATFGWLNTYFVQARDRSKQVDPRLAGINYATNGSPASFIVNVPAPGSYNLSLAMGDDGYTQCSVQCRVQFLDGSTVLGTVTGSPTLGYFYDAAGHAWSAASWPASNRTIPVTMAGTQLLVVVGTNNRSGDVTPISYLGVAQSSGGGSPNFTLSASPTSLSLAQGTQGSSTITTTISGGFSSSVALSASGTPTGTTTSFNPSTIPAPGSGNSTMTFTVGSNTPAGNYPITVTASGGGIRHTMTVNLTVTAYQPVLTVSASPSSLSVAQGTQGTSTITTTIGGGFNSSVALSASGAPAGTTMAFNPSTIPAPGSGNSTLSFTVAGNTPAGTYPITVSASGGGLRPTATVTLTVTASQPTLNISVSPSSLYVVQGTQGTSSVTTTIGGSFNSSVALSSSGAPSGTTISFNPSTIPAPGGGSSTMTITVGASTPTGTYPITVKATGGGLAPTATFTLTITTSGGGGGGSGNSITVSDLSGSGQSNRFVSVGRVFKQGDIPHFAQAVIGGSPILTQCDVKNRWPDGSLKFAIVSFVLPSVSTSGTTVSFQDQSTGNNAGYLQPSDMLNNAYDFDAQMRLTGTSSPSISARAMLQGGQYRYWLQGPIVTAIILEDRDGRSFDVNTDGGVGNPLHPIFEAWFYPQGHKVEVGFTLENSWASSTATNSARNQTYSLALTTGYTSPATQLSQPGFTHIIFSRWRRSFWVDGSPLPIKFNWNWPYLASTGAYANFNPNYTPTSTDVANMYARYTSLPASRLTIPGLDQLNGSGGIANYDENPNGTGYAPWIGPYSQWDVDYLMTGDPRMQQMMTDNADLSGRYPIFFREADHNAGTGRYFDSPSNGTVDTYGHVVSINARQQLTMNLTNWNAQCSGNGPDLVATMLPGDGNGWYTVPGDTSHIPDFAYVPYTLTGKYYYMEHEMMAAGFAVGHGVGCYVPTGTYGRQGHYGLLYSTTRELAWALRTMAYAAFIAPDEDPEGEYFASKTINNFAMVEGEHGINLSVSGNDPSWAYQWGKNYFQFSQAANPSPLNLWRMGDCQDGTSTCYVANGDGANNNINANIVQSAESGFMSSFIDIVFGLTKQLGVVDTTPMLQLDARRYFNILLNPAVNHYLIEQYAYPTTLVGPVCQNPANPGCVWISDWGSFQSGFLTLPTSWSTRQVDYGAEAASALSFMTNLTVDGYAGRNAWNFYTGSDSTQLGLVYHNEPQWSIMPMQ